MKTHYVYFCYRINSKENEPCKYIGVRTCEGNPEDDIGINYFSSSEYLKRDIEKYGLENFEWFVMKKFKTREEANNHELYLHKKYKVGHDSKYYNINYGQNYDWTSHNRAKYRHKKSKQELHDIYSKCQKERFRDLREIWKVSCYGQRNGMWGNGHLLSGAKNGKSVAIRITFTDGAILEFETKKSACEYFHVDRQFITNVLNRGGIFTISENCNRSFVDKMKQYEGMKIEEL